MDDEWLPIKSRTRRQVPEPVPSRAHSLGSILEEQWFLLLMVFEHLVDYGLQECRLVCRKWCEVCRLFPVELLWIEEEHLREVVDAFPRTVATSLSSDEKRAQTLTSSAAGVCFLKSSR